MKIVESYDSIDKNYIKIPISYNNTQANLTGSWRFFKPVLRGKISPCSLACPSNINIAKYMNFIVHGDFNSALSILRNENPFPAVCGRVCPHFCQSKCNRKDFDEEISIRTIERAIGDYGLSVPFNKPKKEINKKIVIVGSGPAGLSCSYFLRKNGLDVTILEREKKMGGLMRYGIPDYRLPKSILDKEIDNILQLGVKTITDINVDDKMLDQLVVDYDAVFFTIGLWKPLTPNNIDIDNKFIFSGIDFLKAIISGNLSFKGYNVGIIGGGNVAIDVARSLLRYNNKPTIIYRRTKSEMPAFKEEINDSEEEGINIMYKKLIDKYEIKNNKILTYIYEVEKIENRNIKLSHTFEIRSFDKLIVATGEEKDFDVAKKDKIFLGGDYVLGASTVIEAIASGKIEAYKIMNFLGIKAKNEDSFYKDEEFFRSIKDYEEYRLVNFKDINTFYFKTQPKMQLTKLSKSERISNFNEIYPGKTIDEIINEAKRCFICGSCNECNTCWFVCPDLSVAYKNGIEFDYSHCKGCGICSFECPHGVIDMIEDE